MVMTDKRRSLIVSTADHFFDVKNRSDQLNEDDEEPLVIRRFLDQTSCRTLCAKLFGTDKMCHLEWSNDIPIGGNALVFFKLTASSITEQNFYDLVHVVSTIGEESNLVEVFRQVWIPAFRSHRFTSSFLKNLEANIFESQSMITIAQEECFWKQKCDEVEKPREKTIYWEAADLLRNIQNELERVAISRDGLIGLEETLDITAGFLDDLWKLGSSVYTVEKMKSLLDVVGNEVVTLVENFVKEVRTEESIALDEALSVGAIVCEKWIDTMERLTKLFWPYHSLHPWKDSPFIPRKCSILGKRLRQIAELRAQHRQLISLLTPSERSVLGTDTLFQCFDDVKVMIYSEDGKDDEWDRLKRKIEEGFTPAEEVVAHKLKAQIAETQTPNSLLTEFRRYRDLIKRNSLKRILLSEREALLTAYNDLIESCQAGPDTENLLENPTILQQVQATKFSKICLESLSQLGKELLIDLPRYKEIVSKVTLTMKDIERKQHQLVELWVNETKSAITRDELTLGTDTAVVELIGTSMMRVTYDSRLTTLIRETRALSSEGVEVPQEIRDLVERASLLEGRAKALQQVATFHNSIGDRIVPSQRPLMLTTALELVRAVQAQSGVVWSDPHAVDGYINRLRELVRKFARQNAELAAKHTALQGLVLNLLKAETISLIGNQSIWKETLMNMRRIIDTVENMYGNTTAWKLHWDRQLLKALGVSYRSDLPSLLRKLPEIKVELTFRDGTVQWRPPLEEIRAKIYSAIRRYLTIPINFRGVGNVEHAHFSDIVYRNAYLFGGVYKHAEIILCSIEFVRKKWLELVAIADVNIGERLKGHSPQEWTKAFKDAKQWAQEVGKLRGEEIKICCISINTGTIRNDLESASRRYWERLCSDLRSEASSRLITVIEFLSSASKELEQRPHNIEEIGLAYETRERIAKQSSNMNDEMETINGLVKVLATWTSEKLDGIQQAHSGWQILADRLQKYKVILARQLEDTKINLRHKGIALQDEIERWETKWSLKSEVLTLDWIMLMKERWKNLIEQRDSLDIDCRRVDMNFENFLNVDKKTLIKLELELETVETNYNFQSEFLEELKNQQAEEWNVAKKRLPRFQDWLDSWENRICIQKKNRQNIDTVGQIDNLETNTFVAKKIREIRAALEWIQLLRGDEIAEEHWAELKTLLNLNSAKNIRDITLGDLLDCSQKLQENLNEVKEITKRAAAESGIRQTLFELELWEGSTTLQLQETKDYMNETISLVGDYSISLTRAGELRLLLEGAKNASGYERFAPSISRYEAGLLELEERIKILNIIQRKWIYLEPIYRSGAAPNGVEKWLKADKEFRYLMGEVTRDPKVASLRRLPLPALTNLRDLLDRSQKSLDEYLEERRSSYPRLYFLSDEDLLELVSGTEKSLDTHLPKLYQGIGSVKRENNNLTAIVSPEGEILYLSKPIDLNDPLSQWLNSLEEEIRNTLRQSLKKCLMVNTPDPSIYPTQVLLLSERIRFTERCEIALKEGSSALRDLIEFLKIQRAKYRGLENISDNLTALKARGLLLDTVHRLQVTQQLLTKMQNNERIFWIWFKQLRFYKTEKGADIHCAAAQFSYSFEYQGATVSLVQTPLTEKCFLSLTQAMKLGLGGSPTGPAGTGKTESVKALGSILGRLVLVFNCDEGMDANSMRRILGGLAQAGAWGCFDEFNRLEEETLSAVAMLVRPLQEAVRDRLSHVLLGDQKVKLDPHCCIFITMNPACNEYGGRHKLPDSLARLFRPIGMAHPDKFEIVRALLDCVGFLNASELAKKLIETLDISETLLSKQAHYDWGLRALRSVLEAIPSDSNLDETSRLLIGIKISTIPKLTQEDTFKFLLLLDDVFPTVNLLSNASPDVQDLEKTLLELCEFKQFSKDIVNRALQLNNQLKNRIGVAIVGPAGSGKTTIRTLLAEAMSEIGKPINQFIIYPGAVPKSKFLGHVDTRTREWKDGLLSSAVLAAAESPTWIIFDGNVEPEWAEALNSALDDNRLLTLSNGVLIKLGCGTRFIFETHKLASASPATVSRLGVVHLSLICSTSLITSSQIQKLSANIKNIMKSCIYTCIDETLKINKECSSSSGLLYSTLCHLQTAHTPTVVTKALLNSLCGQIEDQHNKNDLAHLIYQLTDCWCPDPQKPYDVLYNKESDRLEPFDETYDLINTEDGPISLSGSIKRALSTITPWIEHGYPIVIRGPDGCGKKSLIAAVISLIKNKDNDPLTLIKGSSIYGAQNLIICLKRVCVRLDATLNGRTYKPRNGSQVTLILENLHLASNNTQELIRELIQQGGFHEDDLEFARIPLRIICTADKKSRLHPRLEALLATYHLSEPTSKDIVAILDYHLRNSLIRADISKPYIMQLSLNIYDIYQSMNYSRRIDHSWTLNKLIVWINCLKHYPLPKKETDITYYLLDAGRHLFNPRLIQSEQKHWESMLIAKIPQIKDIENDVYVWKSGYTNLLPLTEQHWKDDIVKATVKCAREGEPVQATITPYLLRTVADICWTFGTHLNGTILTGRPGVGRKSAIKLATAFSSLILINMGPDRGRAALKRAVQIAGVDGQTTLVLLEEHHIREPGLAILANAIITKGEIPGLFTMEELDGLVVPLVEEARLEDFSDTLEQYLYHRLRKFLRVTIVLDNGDVKSTWLLRSGLLKSCLLINPGPDNEWWSLEGPLIEFVMQQDILKNENFEKSSPCIKLLVKSHLRAPEEQYVPARFLALLYIWKELRETWNKEIGKKLISLEAGINKIKEAGEQVAKLENEVSKQRQELKNEKARANAALEQITATMRGATGQRGEITNLKAETERESAELTRRKADIEGELKKVEPLVEQAAHAVAGISADALAEVRSLRAPPIPVRDILEGVLRLMGIKDTSWNSMKTFLAKRGIKEELRTWDARKSSPTSLDAVSKLIKERPDSFEEKTAKRASVAVAPLAAWVLANLQYGQILQQVAPLEEEQRRLTKRLSAAEAQLGKLATGLNTVESRVAQLQEQLAEHSKGAAALQLQTEATEMQLTTARALLKKLNTEYQDWHVQYEELSARMTKLDIDATNVSCLLVYQYPEIDDEWKKSAIELLTTERERLLWRAQGLPADTESLISAVCALKGPLVSIFVDPTGVAVTWLKCNIGACLEITKPDDSKFLITLELAVRFGKFLLIEELIEFPTILLPLLRQRPLIVGDRILPVQKGFKMFLATRRDYVDNMPKEADAVIFKITLGTSIGSLTERFIFNVLLKETPELELQRKEALEHEEKLSGERDAARSELLIQLSTVKKQDMLQVNIDSREGILTSLEITQLKAKEIALALQESRRNLDVISRRTKDHERVAKYAANLYMIIKELTSLNPLYVISIEAFINIYLEAESNRGSFIAKEKEEQDKQIEKKLVSLIFYHCISAAYRKDRLSLALYLALSLNPLSSIERDLLINDNILNSAKNVEIRIPEWIPEERRIAVQILVSLMPEIATNIKSTWLEDIDSIYTDNNLTTFQRVLIIKAIRPDYLHTALSRYAAEQLGVQNLTPPSWTLKQITESKTSNPVLFLLSPGADPSPGLNALATNVAVTKKLIEISLGQGQISQAEFALEAACRNGNWILLSNLQLALNWLPRLESLLRSPMCTTNKNINTKIWLTTEECSGFYPGLAGICTKLAYEPPEGVKRNVERSLQKFDQQEIVKRNDQFPGIFLLSWLHAILQERRKFVPQGWLKPYEWNEADLEVAYKLIIQEIVAKNNENKERDLETGQGLLEIVVYGGRLLDIYDLRALYAIISEVWSKDVFEGHRKLGGVLKLPKILNVNSVKTVDLLNDNDPPKEYFGLPANAHRTWERVTAEMALACLKTIVIKICSNVEKNTSKTELKIQKKLKELITQKESIFTQSKIEFNKKNKDPLQIFIVEEIEMSHKLLNLIRLDIDVLNFESLKTPQHWISEWQSGPQDVLVFVNELLNKHQMLESFGLDIPRQIELSQFFRPRGFLAALKYCTARETCQPLENLKLYANWLVHQKNEEWKIFILIKGLFISGALIEDGNLKDVDANAAPITLAPTCQIAFISEQCYKNSLNNNSKSNYSEMNNSKEHLNIPVYANSQREVFICSLPVGCSRNTHSMWLRRGVALYLKSV